MFPFRFFFFFFCYRSQFMWFLSFSCLSLLWSPTSPLTYKQHPLFLHIFTIRSRKHISSTAAHSQQPHSTHRLAGHISKPRLFILVNIHTHSQTYGASHHTSFSLSIYKQGMFPYSLHLSKRNTQHTSLDIHAQLRAC